MVTAHRTRHTGRLAHRSALLVIPRRAVADPQSPFPVGTAVGVYSLMVQARLIGLLYRNKREEIGWD